MRAIKLAVACFLYTAVVGVSPVIGAGVTTSFTLDRTRFLSTEEAKATLTIVNGSTEQIYFDPNGVALLERADSQWRLRPLLSTFTSIRLPRPIPPGATYHTTITLPSCTVLSDPCEEQIVAQYRAGKRDAYQTYRTPIFSYEFIPDPTATYDVPSLSGNRPVFLSYGIARDTVFPDTFVIDMTAAQSEEQPPFHTTPSLLNPLATAFTKAGVTVSGTGFGTNGSTWQARVFVDHASEQHDAISTALQKVREEFRSRITTISHYFTFDPFGDADLQKKASEEAQAAARRLAEISGAGDVGWSLSRHWVPGRVFIGDSVQQDPFAIQNVGIPDDGTHPIVLDQTAVRPMPIELVLQQLFTGKQPASTQVDPLIASRARDAFGQPGSWWLPPFAPEAVIAADRPELYVTGAAIDESALRDGFAPEAVAILDARRRTSELAVILGLLPQYESLFALYPPPETSGTHVVGVATTFLGGDSRQWQHLRPQPEATAYPEDSPPQKPMLPIEVPDEKTRILVTSIASSKERPDAVRLDVALSPQPSDASAAATWMAAPKATDVVQSLRRLPDVVDVAYGTPQNANGPGAQYEIVLRPADAAKIKALLDTLARGYAQVHPLMQSAIRALAPDCGELTGRLLEEALREDALEAGRISKVTHRRLRKLLLVAVYPVEAQYEACRLRAEIPAGGLMLSNEAPVVPRWIPVFVSATLGFRTFPPQPASQ